MGNPRTNPSRDTIFAEPPTPKDVPAFLRSVAHSAEVGDPIEREDITRLRLIATVIEQDHGGRI